MSSDEDIDIPHTTLSPIVSSSDPIHVGGLDEVTPTGSTDDKPEGEGNEADAVEGHGGSEVTASSPNDDAEPSELLRRSTTQYIHTDSQERGTELQQNVTSESTLKDTASEEPEPTASLTEQTSPASDSAGLQASPSTEADPDLGQGEEQPTPESPVTSATEANEATASDDEMTADSDPTNSGVYMEEKPVGSDQDAGVLAEDSPDAEKDEVPLKQPNEDHGEFASEPPGSEAYLEADLAQYNQDADEVTGEPSASDGSLGQTQLTDSTQDNSQFTGEPPASEGNLDETHPIDSNPDTSELTSEASGSEANWDQTQLTGSNQDADLPTNEATGSEANTEETLTAYPDDVNADETGDDEPHQGDTQLEGSEENLENAQAEDPDTSLEEQAGHDESNLEETQADYEEPTQDETQADEPGLEDDTLADGGLEDETVAYSESQPAAGETALSTSQSSSDVPPLESPLASSSLAEGAESPTLPGSQATSETSTRASITGSRNTSLAVSNATVSATDQMYDSATTDAVESSTVAPTDTTESLPPPDSQQEIPHSSSTSVKLSGLISRDSSAPAVTDSTSLSPAPSQKMSTTESHVTTTGSGMVSQSGSRASQTRSRASQAGSRTSNLAAQLSQRLSQFGSGVTTTSSQRLAEAESRIVQRESQTKSRASVRSTSSTSRDGDATASGATSETTSQVASASSVASYGGFSGPALAEAARSDTGSVAEGSKVEMTTSEHVSSSGSGDISSAISSSDYAGPIEPASISSIMTDSALCLRTTLSRNITQERCNVLDDQMYPSGNREFTSAGSNTSVQNFGSIVLTSSGKTTLPRTPCSSKSSIPNFGSVELTSTGKVACAIKPIISKSRSSLKGSKSGSRTSLGSKKSSLGGSQTSVVEKISSPRASRTSVISNGSRASATRSKTQAGNLGLQRAREYVDEAVGGSSSAISERVDISQQTSGKFPKSRKSSTSMAHLPFDDRPIDPRWPCGTTKKIRHCSRPPTFTTMIRPASCGYSDVSLNKSLPDELMSHLPCLLQVPHKKPNKRRRKVTKRLANELGCALLPYLYLQSVL